MDFFIPFDQLGQAVPGPWKNANPSAGQRGSIVNALMFPAVQNELLAIQDEAGFTRDVNNTAQVMHALRSGRLSSFVDTGTADDLVVSPLSAFLAVSLGTEITVRKGASANARPTGSGGSAADPTLTIGAGSAHLGVAISKPIRKEDGTALAPGDLPAGSLFTVKYDGLSAFRVVGLRKSDSNTSSASFAQTLISNYPSISPPRNGSIVKKTAGAFTFTVGTDCPANITELYVTLVGAGGPGAGSGGSGATWSGGGGGSGGYAADWFAVTNGQSFTYIVGTGGTPNGSGNGNQGTGGGTSSFGPNLQATGGGAAIGGTATCAGGAAGQGSGSLLGLNFPGANGGDGNPGSLTVQGGAGGSSAFGGGGRTSTIGVGAIVNGLAPGSGGGGIWQNNSAAQLGGAGAPGVVIIQW